MGKGVIKKFALGAALAALLGYAAGLLTAPKSGRETRADLKDAASNGLSEAERQLKRLHTELGELIDEIKGRGKDLKGQAGKQLDELISKAQQAKEKTRVVLSAVHEGDAEDEDLKKAVKEANQAIEHLRVFLNK